MNKRQRKKLLKKTLMGILLGEKVTYEGWKLYKRSNFRLDIGYGVVILGNYGVFTIEGENDNEQ